MDDRTTAEYEEWRRNTVVPPYVASKEEGAQRLLGAPFENFIRTVWLAGRASASNPT